MCVSVCLCPCVCWFLSPVKSVWGIWGIIGTWLGKGMLYFEFHAPLHAISCNFGYFSHFLANFKMLGIKMHVFKLRNSMVTLSNTFKDFFMQFHAIFMQFHASNFGYFSHFWANFNMLGIKMHVLKLRNSMGILSRTFTHSLMQFHAIFAQFHAI